MNVEQTVLFPIWSQAPLPPTLATDITAAEVQAVLKAAHRRW